MKVLLINGSPHAGGCTRTALNEVAGVLNECGVETQIKNVGNATVRAITPWWQMAIYAATGVMAVLTAGSAFMLIRSKKKAKNG